MKFKKTKAFTLLELLIVVGITTVLAGVGISSYVNQQRAKLLDTSVQEIVGYLRYAQQKAMAQENGQQWGVHFENPSLGDDFYALYCGSTYEALERTHNLAKETEYRIPSIFYPFYAFARFISSVETRYLPKGIEYESPTAGNSIDVSFNKLTGTNATSTTQSITIKSTVTNSTTTISISGQGLISY
jgi:type II secretory pathway pseudopilin PulG